MDQEALLLVRRRIERFVNLRMVGRLGDRDAAAYGSLLSQETELLERLRHPADVEPK